MVVRSTVSRTVNTSVQSTLGSGGGETPFSPLSIADICSWHDASDNATVLNSIGPNVAATNNQTVRRLLDKSGNDFHFDQTTGLNQPLFKTGQINSLPALDFDSVNDSLIGSCVLNAPYTIVLVAKQRSTGGRRIVLSNTNSGINLSANNGFSVLVAGAVVRATPLTAINTLGCVFLHCPAISGGNVRLYLDSGSNAVSTTRAAANFGTIHLGAHIYSQAADALVCELITYTRDLTDAERTQLVSYASTKWGTPA